MESPDSIGKAFLEFYYTTFDADRAGLANIYKDASLLTFEGQNLRGSQNIVDWLKSLPWVKCKHYISAVDCQPSGTDGGVLVLVSGKIQIEDDPDMVNFSQTFILMPTPQEYYFVLIDIFRLNFA